MAGKDKGLKSSFDLAMERLAQRGEQLTPLSAEQKQALAEIGRNAKAKVAELELAFEQKLVIARAAGKAEEIPKIEELRNAEIRKVRGREEAEKSKIRGQP